MVQAQLAAAQEGRPAPAIEGAAQAGQTTAEAAPEGEQWRAPWVILPARSTPPGRLQELPPPQGRVPRGQLADTTPLVLAALNAILGNLAQQQDVLAGIAASAASSQPAAG